MSGGANGHDDDAAQEADSAEEEELSPPPPEVAELAASCIEFVRRATKMTLDYSPETLPVLDHWVKDARKGAEKGELIPLVAAPAGAYLGEVIRRQARLQWFTPPGEFRRWRLELVDAFVSMNPIGAVVEALLEGEAEGWGASMRLRPEDKSFAADVLDNLGEVSVDDYYLPSTRAEVLVMIADALSRRATAAGDLTTKFGPSDYARLRAEAIGDGEPPS